MEELFSNAITRVPAMENAEVKKFFNGPEAFTPDADFLLGETDVPGFWVAAGGCAHGLAGAGGVGKVMGEWIVDGRPEWDVWPLDVRRFGRQYRSQAYTLARSYEALSQYYDIKYPGEEKQAGRPLRVSPAYARHQALGASFGEKGGWERVNWYESNAAGGDESLRPRGWAGENWSPAIEVEARAAREGDRALRPVVVLEARGARPGRARVPRADVREPDRPARRHDRLHAAAECARRDRGGPLGDAARRGSLPARDRHRVRHARPRVAREARAARRLGLRERRHLGVRVLLPLGAEGARRARSRLPVHAVARDLGRRRPGDRVARHLRRRARLGALLPGGVRAAALGHAARRRRDARRLSRDRCAAAREGLPRLGERPQLRDDAVRGGPRLRGQARQGRVHRPRRARRGAGAEARLPRARRSALDRARLRAGAHGRRRRSSAA